MSTSGNPKERPYSDISPDKSAQILSRALDVCSKCNKKCTSAPKGESIQCDLCGMWAHATCECISREQFKAIKSLSSLSNIVYYCQANDCASRIKNITIDSHPLYGVVMARLSQAIFEWDQRDYR